jgi:hypothetical protein
MAGRFLREMDIINDIKKKRLISLVVGIKPVTIQDQKGVPKL